MASASPRQNRTLDTPRSRARRRASLTIPSVRSRPMTRRHGGAIASAVNPVPVAMSSALAPENGAAKRRSSVSPEDSRCTSLTVYQEACRPNWACTACLRSSLTGAARQERHAVGRTSSPERRHELCTVACQLAPSGPYVGGGRALRRPGGGWRSDAALHDAPHLLVDSMAVADPLGAADPDRHWAAQRRCAPQHAVPPHVRRADSPHVAGAV